MKRIICAFVILCLLLAGCTSPAKITGSWEADLNLAQMITEQMDLGEELGDFTLDDFIVTVVISFQEDGTYTFSLEEESIKTAFAGLMVDLEAAVRTMMEAQLGDMNAEDVLSLLGMDLDTLISTLMEELKTSMDEEDLIGNMLKEAQLQGQYKFEDGKLYMSEGLDEEIDENAYEVCSIDGDTMTWTERVGDDLLDITGLYPVTWKRAA